MATDPERMRQEWDQRARRDAFHFVETDLETTDPAVLFEFGEEIATETIDPILDDWDEYPLADGVALDVGCGIGRITRALGRRFDRAIGVDVSTEMITRARTHHEAHEELEFHATDGVSFPQVAADSVDFVFSYLVIEHFPRERVLARNLAEISRVLAPNGIAVLHIRPVDVSQFVTVFGIVPLPRVAMDFIPRRAKNVYLRLFDDRRAAELKRTDTWTGIKLTPSHMCRACDAAGMTVQQFRPDPTHDVGERLFCLATHAD